MCVVIYAIQGFLENGFNLNHSKSREFSEKR
jgi:hypothetical protein